MQSKKWDKIVKDLEKASKEKDDALRGVKIASVISDALKEIDEKPILVGGAAVAFYTDGRYTTKDIDLIAVGGKELEKIMNQLGFVKYGKDFINNKLKIYIEFSSEILGATEKFAEISVDGRNLNIISIDDLIVDRLCAFKFWKSEIDGLNAMILIELGCNNIERTERRAREDDVLDVLDHVNRVKEKVVREQIDSKRATQLLTSFIYSKKK